MNAIAKVYILNKVKELILKGIYKAEFTEKAKKGIDKLDEVSDRFWEKLRTYIKKEKEIDRKFIPDFAEEIGEEVLSEVLKEARKTFDLKVILQQIFDEEKLGNKNIL